MKTQKRILKIGISLLVAFVMLSSSSLVLAEVPFEAGDNDAPKVPGQQAFLNQYEAVKIPGDIESQQPCPVWIIGLTSIELGPDSNIQEGTYPITIQLWNEPGCGPATVKVFCDIYKKFEGQHIVMYETSFEDNFDIYNNWIQIDADCGVVGGHFDSWSWSDARAFCDDHSFKSTMYDIYKGNQDDYLQCTKSFDVSNQERVIVEFYAWVEGDGLDFLGYYWPYDFLDFEIGDQFGNWMNPYDGQGFLFGSGYLLPGSYYFFDTTIPLYNGYYSNKDYTGKAEDMGGGWWKITFDASVASLAGMGLDVTDIMFRFSWHSDPEYQFEGAYVDCFKVISVESSETKVFQTHSQGHFDIPECESKYTFPLPWNAVGDDSKELCYDIKLWLEVLDPEHFSMNDWPDVVDIYVCVADWFDVQVVDGSLEIETSFGGEPIIPGTGVMEYGEDAHIMAQIHVDGTLPASDITVTATAQAKTWETLYETDFESAMGWTLYNGAHWTTTKAWSGSRSLGLFEEDYNRYINDAFYIAEYAGSFNVQENIELFMDFYSIYITEPGYDYGRACLVDNFHNFVLGMSPALSGYRPDWVGPMQPMGVYQSYDIISAYNYFETAYGFFHDGNGDQVYDVPIGFYFSSDDTINYYSSSIMDSGVWIDDLSVRGLQLGDTVWSDVIVIPGPIEPSEVVDVQFEWEDVPYSNYLICIEADCAGACGNLGDEPECAQILVVTDLEMAHWKEIESIDYTGEGNGEWGISSSDTDNYLATNADGTIYEPNSNAIAMLCPNGDDSCIDISDMFTYAPGTPVTLVTEDFTDMGSGVPPPGWDQYEIGYYFPWSYSTVYYISPPRAAYHGYTFSGTPDSWLVSPAIDTTGLLADMEVSMWFYRNFISWYVFNGLYISTGSPDPLDGDYVLAQELVPIDDYVWYNEVVDVTGFFTPGDTIFIAWNYYGYDADAVRLEDVEIIGTDAGIAPQPPDFLNMTMDVWYDLDAYYDYVYVVSGQYPDPDADGWYPVTINLAHPGMTEQICIRLRFVSDGGWEFRGMKIDDLAIPDIGFGPDPMNNMNNWCTDIMHYGQFWEYDDVENQWCTDFPAVDVLDGLIWSTEIADAYEAYLVYSTEYSLAGNEGLVQISADGGDNWFTLNVLTGSSGGWESYQHNLNFWVGSDILIRFLADGAGYAGHWCVKNIMITGKEDNDAPNTQISMTGTMTDAGWYSSAVTATITATDVGAGMGEIHYILDGVETVKAGETTTFTISGNGAHNIEFWGVDKVGNEETPHNIVPTFRIDAGSPPTVSINEPTPGLYLFGNKLLSLSKIFIIGAFTIEASASDAESGVYKVQFLLDGDVIAEDTEAPYSAYCAIKHSGAGVIKVKAEDFSGNTAEDTLDITYYKFL
jgi:plastocyanin